MRWDIGIDLGTRNVRMVTEGAKEAFAQSAALALRAGEGLSPALDRFIKCVKAMMPDLK